ncbi:MAG: transglutaminase protein [Bacteroidetes bacterium]|nr:transglutaminase protein [Bacteroidota bacterium]
MSEYLRPTAFIDSDSTEVIAYAHSKANENMTDREKVVALYNAVRDDIMYDPYHIILSPDAISGGQTLKRKSGYCIEKSLLLAACGRVFGIPSRLGFSIVQNHISSEKFVKMLRSDKFVFHGYNEFLLDGQWVKCTPAFNKALCDRFGTAPLEFDGVHDSIFQEFSPDGKQYMKYLHEYGQFDDLPYDLFVSELKVHYPHLFDENGVMVQKLND